MKQRWILSEPVVMYRKAGGKPVVVVYDVCSYRSTPLSKGELLGDHLHRGDHSLGPAWHQARAARLGNCEREIALDP